MHYVYITLTLKQIFIAVTFLMPTVDLDCDSRVIDVLTCGLWPWSRALHTSAEIRAGQCCYCNLQGVQQIQQAQEVQSHPCHPERGKKRDNNKNSDVCSGCSADRKLKEMGDLQNIDSY